MRVRKAISAIALGVFVLPFFASSVDAHCDGWDGPVVLEAQEALRAGNLAPVLKWVSAEHEPEISAAFEKAVAASREGELAKEIGETWFLETLVRIHREGEGAPYTGLKPAGQIEPAIQFADQALKNGSVESLAGRIGAEIERQIEERFAHANELKAKAANSPEAGREYVEAYVNYIHFVEGISNLVHHGPHGHD